MKKILITLLIGIMLVVGGCGKKPVTPSNNKSPEVTAGANVNTRAANTSDSTDEPVVTELPGPSDNQPGTTETEDTGIKAETEDNSVLLKIRHRNSCSLGIF